MRFKIKSLKGVVTAMMSWRSIFAFLFLFVCVESVFSEQITKPYTFSSGTTVKSAEVNADFDLLYNKVNQLLLTANNTNSSSLSWDFETSVLGWNSTNISKMYWDKNNKALFVSHYKPDANGIFYDLGRNLAMDFTLKFDVKLTRADFDINLFIGLASDQNYVSSSGGPCVSFGTTKFAGLNFLYVASHNGGTRFDLTTSEISVSHDVSNTIHWTTNVWYTIKLMYTSSNQILRVEVYDSLNNLLDSHNLTGYSLSGKNLRLVGVHMFACNNNTSTVEALIDNISIY
ncbi:MAG: hypothetical protein HQL05_15840 [Nitrospirae bacterium]|uniref:hypothetical protein n=1 Tax=Candidatus Magnetobacterium casense TaxID=1455061 RepID=UPI00058AD256|nr:hypothetical protein [Candidatus Magnetobacterium casensis]MBF0339291.1 hypothetical protein [Nitrospirota bacterium]